MPVLGIRTSTLSIILALSSTVVESAPVPDDATNNEPSASWRNSSPSSIEWVLNENPSYSKAFQEDARSFSSRPANRAYTYALSSPNVPSGVSLEVKDAALLYLSAQTGVPQDLLKVQSGFTDDVGSTHFHVTQLLNGIPVAHRAADIALDKAGKVIQFDSNIVKPVLVSEPTPVLSLHAAIRAAEHSLGLSYLSSVPATLAYIAQDVPYSPSLNRTWARLTYQVDLRNADASLWVQAHVDATVPFQGVIVDVVDLVVGSAAVPSRSSPKPEHRVDVSGQREPTWGWLTRLGRLANLVASPQWWDVGRLWVVPDTSGHGNPEISHPAGSDAELKGADTPSLLKASLYDEAVDSESVSRILSDMYLCSLMSSVL